jgi:hypothetical protein
MIYAQMLHHFVLDVYSFGSPLIGRKLGRNALMFINHQMYGTSDLREDHCDIQPCREAEYALSTPVYIVRAHCI